MKTYLTKPVDQTSSLGVLSVFFMSRHKLVGRIIPNGKCSHQKFRLLITISDEDAHKLQDLLNKQVKVLIECI